MVKMGKKNILVTGGCGFIGSLCVLRLIENGFEPVIIDDFSNSSPRVLDRIYKLCGIRPNCYQFDLRDGEALEKVFRENKIEAVIHFAGKKSVKESAIKPLEYYLNNVGASLVLLEKMKKFQVKKLIFSSTATVYGNVNKSPLSEGSVLEPINNYGKSKQMVEDIISSTFTADKKWSFVILRYFNPVGAHPSGMMGEDPNGVPANLMPYIAKVADGKLPQLMIFGNDYPTRDGTGERDYIHVLDLVDAHISSLSLLQNPRLEILNIGTGHGITVMEMINAFSRVNHVNIPYKITERRSGDSAISFANVDKVRKILGWTAKRSLEDMCRDVWNWQKKNPYGYKSEKEK